MKNAFCSFIYGKYYRFIPYYLFSIKINYPNTDVILLYNNILPDYIKKYVLEYKNVILLENVGSEFEWVNNIKHKGAVKQSLRHVLYFDFFQEYDNIYFGDVDILLLNESENLFTFHTKQSLKRKLPFSNRVRTLPSSPLIPSKRLTGLHFVNVESYFEKMRPIQIKFIENVNYRNEILNKSDRNEEVLYYLCKDAFKFDSIEVSKNKRPWHGFHLGLVRGKNFLNLENVKANSSLTVNELKQELLNLNEEGELNKLLYKFYCREVYFTYKSLRLNLPFLLVQYYKIYEFKDKLISFFKRLKNSLRKQFTTP
jgi:hypothetical protein